MNPKKTNRIAKHVIYGSVGLLVILLLFLIGYILITGLPGMSWHFLTSVSQSFEAGGGIRDQIFNSVYFNFNNVDFISNCVGGWDLPCRICKG